MTPVQFKNNVADAVRMVDWGEAMLAGFVVVPATISTITVDGKFYAPKFGRESVQKVISNIRGQVEGVAASVDDFNTNELAEEAPPGIEDLILQDAGWK